MSLGEASTADTLGELQGKGDKFTKLALIEKKKMTDLQDAIQFIVNQTEMYRDQAKKAAIDVMNIHVLTPNPAYSRADGVNIGKEAQIVTAKTLNILEAKLNKLLQRKSELKNQIKKQKETINHYRLIRLQTDLSHQKYEQVLEETKLKIETILAESTKVVEDREKILEKKDQLERMNVEEQQKFTEEYEEMGRFIKAQNDALENALLQERKADRHHDQKMAKRASSPPTSATSNTNNPTNGTTSFDPSHATTSLSLQEEIEMAKKVGSLTSFMNAEQSSLSDLREKIASYESMFEQLKKMTNVENLEDMVTNYIAHEEEMFSLYNFIQTVNAEIDTVVEATAQTEQAIAKFKEDQQDQDQQRRSTIDELQQRLANVLESTRALVEQNSVQQESILQISKKVSSVFFKLQCDQMDSKGQGISKSSSRYSSNASNSSARPDSKIALLTGQGVTESNVLDYLGCIEQRAVDIITEYLRIMHHKEVTNSASGKLPTNTNGLSFTNNLTGGMRSPTPGPPTPMNWQRREPLIDVGDISDDEYLIALESIPLTSTGTVDVNNVATLTTLTPGKDNPTLPAIDNDNKIVDLNVFKSKLQKKLGLKESTSTPLLSSTRRKLTTN